MLIAVDGIDGDGKTTICRRVAAYLEGRSHEVTLYEMGELGILDDVFADIKTGRVSCTAEIREYLHYLEGNVFGSKVVPEFLGQERRHILVHRYLLSYLSYGPLNGVLLERIRALTDTMPWPDIYLYIDVKPETALRRISACRKAEKPEIGFKNHLEADDEAHNLRNFLLHQTRVRDNFLTAIGMLNKPVRVIDGEQELVKVTEDVFNSIRERLGSS